MSARRGPKRAAADRLDAVQEASRRWWETTPMTYDWTGAGAAVPGSRAWFADQDRRSAQAHRHFATRRLPFDRIIPFDELRGREVLEIGTGSGFHSELLARAGARVTGIDLTDAAVGLTRRRFELAGLEGEFLRHDAQLRRADFERRFSFVWSWGVVHHSALTGRIVRNVAGWLRDDGRFAGMVYHRDSIQLAVALVRQWVLRGRALSCSVDEALWRNTDGFSARFYPADQWRDLLMTFFSSARTSVTGLESDLPLPRGLRPAARAWLSERTRARILSRLGAFLVFDARGPLHR